MRKNSATVKVTLPDGCRLDWTTKPGGKLSEDPVAFGRWLIETGERIVEASTTLGQHATKNTAEEKGESQ